MLTQLFKHTHLEFMTHTHVYLFKHYFIQLESTNSFLTSYCDINFGLKTELTHSVLLV